MSASGTAAIITDLIEDTVRTYDLRKPIVVGMQKRLFGLGEKDDDGEVRSKVMDVKADDGGDAETKEPSLIVPALRLSPYKRRTMVSTSLHYVSRRIDLAWKTEDDINIHDSNELS